MKFDVLTLFPEMFETLNSSIIGRAKEKNLIEINLINIRDFSKDKHKKVDDTPYGGGAGMVMKPDVVYDAYKSIEDKDAKVIYMSPQGKKLNQKKVEELAKNEHLIILCGHYEGIDQRALELIQPEEVSLGDFVLTGGELPAITMIDCISRLVPGVLGKDDSAVYETFYDGLVEYPQYTRPEEYMGLTVPKVLLSGDHKKVEEWRRNTAIERTKIKRPDMYEKYMEEHKNDFVKKKQKRVNKSSKI